MTFVGADYFAIQLRIRRFIAFVASYNILILLIMLIING